MIYKEHFFNLLVGIPESASLPLRQREREAHSRNPSSRLKKRSLYKIVKNSEQRVLVGVKSKNLLRIPSHLLDGRSPLKRLLLHLWIHFASIKHGANCEEGSGEREREERMPCIQTATTTATTPANDAAFV